MSPSVENSTVSLIADIVEVDTNALNNMMDTIIKLLYIFSLISRVILLTC